jgi:hypothetical protein
MPTTTTTADMGPCPCPLPVLLHSGLQVLWKHQKRGREGRLRPH